MKINGADEIIKLLLDVKAGEAEIKNSSNPLNAERTAQKADEAVPGKDEFILNKNNIAAEIKFTKSPGETPEAYFHRISNELIRQRDNIYAEPGAGLEFKDPNREMAEHAIRSGLLKDFMAADKENNREQTKDNGKKWLYRFIVIFTLMLLLYFFILK